MKKIIVIAATLSFLCTMVGKGNSFIPPFPGSNAPPGCTNVAGALSCVSLAGDGSGITGVPFDDNETHIQRLIDATSFDGNDTEINRLITAGTAAKALALNANGSNCSAGYSPLGVDAAGAVEGCWQVTPAAIGAIATGGNAGTASALAANGANCSAGQAPLGVDASGAVEGCWTPSTDGNDTEINRLITMLVQGGTLSFSGVSYSTVRQAADSVSGTKGQKSKWYEDKDDGDSQYTLDIKSLDGNFTDTIEGSTKGSALNFATTGTITGRLYVTEDESDNHTLTATELKGGTVEMDGNGTVQIDDNGTTGDLFCVKARTSGVKKVRPNKLSQPIYKHDMTSLGAGIAIKSGGAAGERACFYVSPNGYWQQEGDTTWVTE